MPLVYIGLLAEEAGWQISWVGQSTYVHFQRMERGVGPAHPFLQNKFSGFVQSTLYKNKYKYKYINKYKHKKRNAAEQRQLTFVFKISFQGFYSPLHTNPNTNTNAYTNAD